MNLNYPITVSMTPAFYDTEHMLLRAQLKCLSKQTVMDFDVWLIDPHYQKRKDIIPELSDRFGLDIKHIPYIPAQHISKVYDCAIFNAPFVYSPSPINVRYSCYRFVRPTFIETIINAPAGINVDFYWHSIKGNETIQEQNMFWGFDREDVNWENCPTKSSDNGDGTRDTSFPARLADPDVWPRTYDEDRDVHVADRGMYGNIAWHRDQWLFLNGTNEVITNGSHWEDLCFGNRANLAGQLIVRRTNLIYRLHHHYGSHSQRSNAPVDHPYNPPCVKCTDMYTHYTSFDYQLDQRIKLREVESFEESVAWVCKKCKLSGPILGNSQEIQNYLNNVRERNGVRAPIIPKYKIGRNLQILSEMVDRESTLEGKIDVYNNSWESDYFYKEN
jgi:hypothetical protein